MERITMRIDERPARDFDQLNARRGYSSRSEALPDLLRREVETQRPAREPKTPCVACAMASSTWWLWRGVMRMPKPAPTIVTATCT